ncbi:transposase [Lewinella sp. 4G2]|uniref:transposase n=1 Tax=Lewinella sp. 4G2 TaxID=1803372 RepID=UPI0007DEAF43|nr:transposase [Lewinella sp. 4G2]OAV42616.1 hypothetical protein A3850_015325 [Lewinella sp. 4G2]OAV42712.1 hypothetical protein A3850_015845 [Lewinella sp. 4G2]OAV42883.1 hypothetical protein A3850_016795 [Lewinella sp. 4G2]OAV43220.1 hypothetical protein A3850_001340 [Lewinella sp. 4G2]OAV43273.1 hypothetical protein A3850_001625 [Lewinella sp. 4G2]
MSTKNRKIRPTKRYGECFKRARVKDFEEGTFSVKQMVQLYGVSYQTIYNWIAKYSSMAKKNAVIVEVPNSQTAKLAELQRQLAEQQALLGRMAIQLDHKTRMLAIYEEEMPEFKKKAASTLRSADSSSKKKSQ